jgi:hypothetical protein
MRVVLRNPHAADGRDFRFALTVGGEYEVLGIEADWLRLLTDGGEPVLFDPECFDITDPTVPGYWVSVVGEEGERYAYPPGWGVPGFFEAWHDGNAVVRKVFAEQMAFWYPTVETTRKLHRPSRRTDGPRSAAVGASPGTRGGPLRPRFPDATNMLTRAEIDHRLSARVSPADAERLGPWIRPGLRIRRRGRETSRSARPASPARRTCRPTSSGRRPANPGGRDGPGR